MLFEIGVIDIIDIVLVALTLYYVYRLMKESRSLNIFLGTMFFIAVWLVVNYVIGMRLLGAILDKLVSVGVIAIIVLFQDEIRNFLDKLGAHQRINFIYRMFRPKHKEEKKINRVVVPIVLAAKHMSSQKVGALIVLERQTKLDDVVSTGELIDAAVSQRLIENIFFKNSPLHDGAMIISNQRIKAAACILPVSHDMSIPQDMGLRHRAAMGMSQESDAVTVVVSEQTGAISIISNGVIYRRLTPEKLESILNDSLANTN